MRDSMAKCKTVYLQYLPTYLFICTLLVLLSGIHIFAEDYNEWKYSTTITINTTSLGLSGDVTSFPLLVRLDKNNFSFASAKSDGTDIRFSQADGTHLFFDRERWDSPNEEAEFWVLVNVINPNNNTQYIRIHWGKADAPDSSASQEVFHTSNKFAGVWHLNEDPTGGIDAIKDRTGNANNGTPGGSLVSNGNDLVDGVIGKAIVFNGSNDNINVGSHTSLDELDIITVESWINSRSWGGGSYGRIIDKHASVLNLMLANTGGQMGTRSFALSRDRITDDTDVRAADNSLNNFQWYHIAAVMNGTSSCRLFLNGSEVPGYVLQNLGSGSLLSDDVGDLLIGNRLAGDRGFHGIIDELRIASTARSDDWIKLNYATQQLNQTMVTVIIPDQPIISTHPQSDTVQINESVSFSVVASGTPTLQYEWQKSTAGGWDPINGAINATYQINQISVDDSGDYRVLVTNNYGADTSLAAHLHVLSDSTAIISHPQSDTVANGESAQFVVTASGVPTPTYQWIKNGMILNNQTDSILNIPSVSYNDSGVYQAIASNALGSDTSHEAYLIVYDSSISITSQPINDTVLAGNEAIFGITATGNRLTYQWQEYITSFTDIPGATTDTLKFIADTSLNNRYYRCIVSSGPVNLTSSFAQLIVATKPTITINLPADSILLVGDDLTFTASATSLPSPNYIWYVKPTPTADSIEVSTGATLNLNNLSKQEEGYYFFIAENGMGKAQSNTMRLHVVYPIQINIDLPGKYFCTNGATAIFKPDVSGDGIISHRWYENGLELPNDTLDNYTIAVVDSATHHGNIYYCEITNYYLSQPIKTVTTRICTLEIQKYYNPFKIKAERVNIQNTTEVRMKLWSDVDISSFPVIATNPPSLWADSLWVLYKSNGFASDIASADGLAMFSTKDIKETQDTLFDTITVGPLPPQNDSCFWFNYSVLWHDPSGPLDTLLRPLTEANKLLMVDTLVPANPLRVSGIYRMKTDTVLLIIDNIQDLNNNSDSLVIIQCSFFPKFDPLKLDTSLAVSTLLASGHNQDTLIWAPISPLPIELDTMFCRWNIIGKNSVPGQILDTLFMVGWPRPVYLGTLTADSTGMGNEMHLAWTAPTEKVDSIRIWWDTTAIPLTHTVLLPHDQSHYIDLLTLTIDTIKALSNNTLYHFGLQVFRDDMWSSITAKSSDCAKTSLGDTTVIPNIIAIDTSHFDPVSNSMVVNWHLNLNLIPGGKKAVSGFSYTLADTLDPNQKPIKWDPVDSNNNITIIPLGSQIVFDTVYTVGLWLRGLPGLPTPPTCSSTVKIPIPSFTWQVITLFPQGEKVVYGANQKIIFKEILHFDHTDTIRSFKPDSFPSGLVQVGGIAFSFTDTIHIPSFVLGLKYDALPSGVTPDNLGLYQYVNGHFKVMHGFFVDSGAVWDTISHEDIIHPFMVLADIEKPIISTVQYNDTVSPDETILTQFTVRDNIVNNQWQFLYGSGHEAYTFEKSGIFDDCNDTTMVVTIVNQNNVVNPSFGLRAIIIVSDGINSDTLNVSRRVRSSQSNALSITEYEWIPITANINLDEPELPKIFDNSDPTNQPWNYDIYKHRLFRWYNKNTNEQNQWLQYDPSDDNLFALQPGRLIWYKSIARQQLKLGKGVTTSLKAPFEITLKPKNWTDLTLPFYFPIMLRDILEATGVENCKYIDVCHWQKVNSSYEAIPIFNSHLDSVVNETDTVFAKQKSNGYTFYNNHSQPITLKIPPICLSLSKYAAVSHTSRSEPREPSQAWDIKFNWRLHSMNQTIFRQLRCGYKKSDVDRTRFGTLPPSMSKVAVGFGLDNNQLGSWVLKTVIEKGGISFPLIFQNSSEEAKIIEYYLDNLEKLPKQYLAKVLNPETHTYEECINLGQISTVKVKPHSKVQRLLVIGTQEYLNHMTLAFLPPQLINAYPNPFNGKFKIFYRLPIGIKEVNFSMYNLRGQLIWHDRITKEMTPGYHSYIFDDKLSKSQKNVLAAGVYVMQLTAKNNEQKTIYGGKKRIFCIK